MLTFTPLEAMLLGAGISIFTGLVVRICFNRKYVTRHDCRQFRLFYLGQKRDNRLLFAMLRSVISHMDNLNPKERERILNMKAESLKEDFCDE